MNHNTIFEIGLRSPDKLVQYVKSRLEDYKPHKVKRKEIPKPNGGIRPLGIPTIEDRLIQQCLVQVLEPICEARFHKHSYGFRPQRSQIHAYSRAVTLANKQWLRERLGLEISNEKSKVVNLRKNYSEFLGFKFKVVPKGKQRVVKSHMTDKSRRKVIEKIKTKAESIRRKPNKAEVTKFNSTILEIHNDYRYATHTTKDFSEISFPIDGVKHKSPLNFTQEKNSYTENGRILVHNSQEAVPPFMVHYLMENPIKSENMEYNDNRLSKYIA